MAQKAFDRKIEALDALRASTDAGATRQQLRKALTDRNNFLVARAAEIAADHRFEDLIPDLLATYDRFFVDPAKSDPHCLAKLALARSLHDLGHHGADAYVRGVTHVQLEPGWGGRADTAGPLRGACARALTDCFLDDLEILRYLTDALADPHKTVRIDAAIAIDQLNRPEGALLLRLRLLVGDSEAEVLGQCCTSLLSLAPDGAVDFVARFLRHADADVQIEAASALAQCRDAHAIDVLRAFWQGELLSVDLRRAILIGLGASPLRECAEFLLWVVASEPPTLAETAITALATSRFAAESQARAADALATRAIPALQKHFDEKFGSLQ
ncbi:MAG TPA: HEAT repeat domain-containing protein [Chloroflexota bacterium]